MKDAPGMQWSNRQALVEEGASVNLALSARRSEKLQRLFSFLLEQSRQGRQPREEDIIAAIRGDDGPGQDAPGSSVRVYVSRLRKMLDQHYATRQGPRLVIPRGEYRLDLVMPDRNTACPDGDERTDRDAEPPAQRPGRKHVRAVVAALLGLNLAIGAVFWATGDRASSDLASTSFWRPLVAGSDPAVLVVGDHFLFGERRDGTVTQLVRDFAVRNEEDFRNRIAASGDAERYVDLDLAYTSSNLVAALRTLWTALQSLGLQRPVTSVNPASRLDPEIFKNNNVIYVGPLDGTGRLLGNVIARASAFTLSADGSQLFDRLSHHRYQADAGPENAAAIPFRDYGYIASLPGPSNNRIIVIAGLGDAGIAQMADLANSSANLADLTAKTDGKTKSFEALYQIRAMYSQGYSRRLVAFHPVKDQAIWDGGDNRANAGAFASAQ